MLVALLLLATLSTCLTSQVVPLGYEHPRTIGPIHSSVPKAPKTFGVKPKIVGGIDLETVYKAKLAEDRVHQLALLELQQLLARKGQLPRGQLPAGTTSDDMARARNIVEDALLPRQFSSAVLPSASINSSTSSWSVSDGQEESAQYPRFRQKVHHALTAGVDLDLDQTGTAELFSKLESVLSQFDKRQDLLEETIEHLNEQLAQTKEELTIQKQEEARRIHQSQQDSLAIMMETMSAVLSGDKKKANAMFLQIQESAVYPNGHKKSAKKEKAASKKAPLKAATEFQKIPILSKKVSTLPSDRFRSRRKQNVNLSPIPDLPLASVERTGEVHGEGVGLENKVHTKRTHHDGIMLEHTQSAHHHKHHRHKHRKHIKTAPAVEVAHEEVVHDEEESVAPTDVDGSSID